MSMIHSYYKFRKVHLPNDFAQQYNFMLYASLLIFDIANMPQKNGCEKRHVFLNMNYLKMVA